MQMRIAFSVATGFPTDILIVDEAMAVGDAHFQQKCFHRIEKFKQAGGTLLFVSHDPGMIKTLCSRALLLDDGRLIKDGSPKDVMDLYQALVSKQNDLGEKDLTLIQQRKVLQVEKKGTSITSSGDAKLIDFCLMNKKNEKVFYLESEEILNVSYKVKFKKFFERPSFGLIIRDKFGNSIFEASSYSMGKEQPAIEKDTIIMVKFAFEFNLRAGHYSFSIGVSNKGFSRSEFEEIILLIHDVEQIQVIESPSSIFYGGVFNMNPKLQIKVLQK
jgi:lipopolysaccharide transport system ATP-binding protein